MSCTWIAFQQFEHLRKCLANMIASNPHIKAYAEQLCEKNFGRENRNLQLHWQSYKKKYDDSVLHPGQFQTDIV